MSTTANQREPNSDTTKAAVHRLAANNDPATLTKLAMNACAALMAHYDVAIDKWQAQIDETIAAGCRCDSCMRDILEAAENVANFGKSRERLGIAGPLLIELEWGFPPAQPGEIEKHLNELDPEDEDDGQEVA